MSKSGPQSLSDQLRLINSEYPAAIVSAFASVDRRFFIDETWVPEAPGVGANWRRITTKYEPAQVYGDTTIVTAVAGHEILSSSTRPSLMADMLTALNLRTGDRVLEIGTGTGYNAALLATMVGAPVGTVVSYEYNAAIAERARKNLLNAGSEASLVSVTTGDAFNASLPPASFDRVIATSASSDIARTWADSLTESGRLLVPLDHGGIQPLVLAQHERDGLVGHVVGWTSFLRGRGGCVPNEYWPSGVIFRDPDESPILNEPLWPELGRGAPLRFLPAREDEADFYFFVALNDSNAMWTPWGPGLSTTDGWIAASAGRLRAQGEQSHQKALRLRLRELYELWEEAGRPSAKDYRIVFRPIDDTSATTTDAPSIRRRDYVSIYEL